MASRSYRDLEVRRKAMDLLEACCRLAENLPAERHGRIGERRRRVAVAHEALMALETHILLIQSLQRCDAAETEMLLDKAAEVGRALGGLRKSLEVQACS